MLKLLLSLSVDKKRIYTVFTRNRDGNCRHIVIMAFATQVLVAVILFCAKFATGDETCEFWRQDVSNKNFTSSMHMLDTFYDSSSLMCAYACERNSQCKSFFYNRFARVCQLHEFVVPENGAFVDATSSNGTEYYR